MLNEPDHIEIVTSQYDCGECGYAFLDRVFDDEEDRDFVACPNCGWTGLTAGPKSDYVEEEWFQARYC